MRQFGKLLLGLIALVVCLSVGASEIGSVDVEMLDGSKTPEILRTFIGYSIESKVGEEFNPATLSKDLATLFKTGSFDDVKTSVSTGADGKVSIIFKVSSRKPVSRIVISGNTQISERKLLARTKHGVNTLLDYAKVSADRKSIRDLYGEKGYFGTEVTSQVIPNPDGNSVTIEYLIKECEHYKLKGVDFVGNAVVQSSDLRRIIMTKRQWWRYIFRFGNYYNSAYEQVDRQRIAEYYQSLGFWDGKVVSTELKFDENKEWVRVIYHIDEGEAYTVGSISLSGSERFSAEELLARTELTSGDVLTSVALQDDIAAIKEAYERLGYIDLKFNDDVKYDAVTHVADINYVISEGMPSRIQDVLIVGNNRTQDHVIRRELTIKPDDLADSGKIRQSKRRIENLGYFEEVNISTETTASPALKNIRLEVSEKPTGSLSLGAGYSTEDSVLGYMELTERNFDLGKALNLERPVGGGQHFRAYVGLGADTRNINISLTEPSLFDSDFELSTGVFCTTRGEDEYDERHVGVETMLSWPVAFMMPLFNTVEYWRMGVGLRLEQNKISAFEDEEKQYDRMLKEGADDSGFRYPKGKRYSLLNDKGSELTNRMIFRMTRDTRDSFMFPSSGSKVELDAEYVTKALGSYADYMKLHAGFVNYTPIAYDLILKLAADGYTVEHFSGDPVRVFDRYFAGGYGTIRGFKRHAVGPVNQIKNSIGGKTMVVGSLEVIKPYRDFMFFRVFMDVGNVWEDSFEVDSDFCASVGFGVQFKAIPVKLDYGIPIKKDKHLEGHGRLHFNIDYAF